MKLSEVIEKLQKILDEKGDAELYVYEYEYGDNEHVKGLYENNANFDDGGDRFNHPGKIGITFTDW